MTTCPACHHELHENLPECPHCGVLIAKWKPHPQSTHSENVLLQQTPVTVSTLSKSCSRCKGTVSPQAVWCPHCGHPVGVKFAPSEMDQVTLSPTGMRTRLVAFLVLGLILFLGYQEWDRRQAEPPPESVPVRPPPTVMPAPPAETQPSQPTQLTQPTQPTIALSNPPDQQPPSLPTGQPPADDRKGDSQGEKQKLRVNIVSIATVLANPKDFINVRREPGKYTNIGFINDVQISLKGTVQEPQVYERYGRLHDDYGFTQHLVCSQRFILVDDTGSMPAYNNFVCDAADRQSLTLAPGDQVVVTGTLDWSGRGASGNFLSLMFHVTNIMRL